MSSRCASNQHITTIWTIPLTVKPVRYRMRIVWFSRTGITDTVCANNIPVLYSLGIKGIFFQNQLMPQLPLRPQNRCRHPKGRRF
jgi:hypothetical protein